MLGTSLITRSPFNEMRDMLDVFQRGWPRLEPMIKGPEWENLAVDVYDKDGTIVVVANLPGIDKKDVDIHITDDVLTIKAEHREVKEVDEKAYYLRERRYGLVQRSLHLPADVDADKAMAKFKDGTLTLEIPHKGNGHTRNIKVKVA